MSSFKYVESIVNNNNVNLKGDTLIKKGSVNKKDFNDANIAELPKDDNFMFIAQSKKGHDPTGGLDAISGQGLIGSKDSSVLKDNDPIIEKTGLGYDITDKMHFLDEAKGYSFKKPSDKIFNIHDCPKNDTKLKDFDYGFTKSAQWGYKSIDHGLHTTLLQIPEKIRKAGPEESLNFKIDSKERAKVGAKNAYGYHSQNIINSEGYMENMEAKDILVTLSAGITTAPSNIPFKYPYGYNKNAGYNRAGFKVAGHTDESVIPPETAKGKIGKVGFHTPYRMNSIYPIVNGKLVA